MKKIFLMLIFVSILLTGCKSENDISNLGEVISTFGKSYSENDEFIISTYEKVLTETLTLEEWEKHFNDVGYSLTEIENEGEFGKYTSHDLYFPHQEELESSDTGLMKFSFYEIDDTIINKSKYVELYVLPTSDDLDYTLDIELAKIRRANGYNLRNSNTHEMNNIWSKGTYEEQSIGRGVSLLASKNVGEYQEMDYALIRDSHLGTELYQDEDINAEFIMEQILNVLDLELSKESLIKYMSKYNTSPRTLDIGENTAYIWGNSYDDVKATIGLPVNYWEFNYVKYDYVIRANGVYQLNSESPVEFIERLFTRLAEKYDVELNDNEIIFKDLSFNKNIDSLSLEFNIKQHCLQINLDIYLKN